MPRDYGYDYAFRPRRRRALRGPIYARPWDDRSELDERMGMHDLSEHYGRYSGGPPYGYEYSERSIEHRHPGTGGFIGFTRPLGRREWAQGRQPGERAPAPLRPWEAYEPPRERERFEASRTEGSWQAYPPRRGRDRYWTFRGNRHRR